MQPNTILIVEDDALLRADTLSILEDAGLSVVESSDADDAIGVLSENSTEIAAVLTDIEMPGHSDGVHLAEVIARQWPHIGVIVTSGRGNAARPLPSNAQFMAKPLRPADVVEAMQHIVEAA